MGNTTRRCEAPATTLDSVDVVTRLKVIELAKPIETETGVSLTRMLGKERLGRIVRARHMLFAAMWRGHFTHAEIATVLGVDHSTVTAALHKTVPAEEYMTRSTSRKRAS